MLFRSASDLPRGEPRCRQSHAQPPLFQNPQDAKSRNKERTARGHQLCYFLVEMNALTESANGEGNTIKEREFGGRCDSPPDICAPRQLSAMEPLFSLASTITAIPRWRSCSECIPGRPEPHGQPEADQGADGTRLPSARRCRKPSRLLCRSDRRLKTPVNAMLVGGRPSPLLTRIDPLPVLWVRRARSNRA